ncbi:hypothetical protein CX658_18730 [Pseudomonas amygdali pv. lachrymans]|nr:hypothetical protein CX658_18730 [Pseudomonas amygdali pv. lachrymans]
MPTPEPKFVQHLGRSYLVVAQFPNTESGIKESNQYMTRHPKAGVLLVEGDQVLLSHSDDKGTGAGPTNMTAKAKRAVSNYGAGVCLDAYRQTFCGDGARTIALSYDLTTRQADAAIDAGRELAGGTAFA